MSQFTPNEAQLFEGTKTFNRMMFSLFAHKPEQIKAVIAYGKTILKVDYSQMNSVLYSEIMSIRSCVDQLEEKLNKGWENEN